MKKIISILTFLSLLLAVNSGYAAQAKVFVSDFSVVGVQEKAEIKQILRTMMASRLNSDFLTVGAAEDGADVVISGTYIVIGRIFSLDAIAKDKSGKIAARSIVQGEGQEELIPAISNLAGKMTAELGKIKSSVVPITAKPAK